MSNDNNDTPDIPAHIAARRTTALTPLAAESLKTNGYLGDDGNVRLGGGIHRPVKKTAAEQDCEARARKYAGPYPLHGMDLRAIDDVRNKGYTGAPAMTPALGDRTPAFVNWLWANYPWDAAKRFGGTREIWPTKLPAKWPPAEPTAAPEPASTRTYSQAEVDAMMAGKGPQTVTTVAPAAKPKRKRITVPSGTPPATPSAPAA